MTIERTIITIVLWVICFIALPMQAGDKSRYFDPKGPDAYMRLERVNLLATTGDWYENQIHRAGGPQGADIHWTRPMDILVLAAALPMLPFMDMKEAIELGGVALPALLSLALVFLCIWAVRPYMQPKNMVLIVLLLAVQPLIQNYFGMGRVDHHAFLAVLMAAVLGFLVRATLTEQKSNHAIWAGILSALGLWVSLEFLVVYAPIVAGLGISWLVWGGKWLRINRDFALSSFVLLVICFAVDTPVQDWFADRYDRLSVPQLLLVFLPALFWLVVGKLEQSCQSLSTRTIVTSIFGLSSLFFLYVLFPNLFVGPLSETDPRIGPIWHDKVTEMSPLIKSWRQGVWYCLLPFACLIYCGLIISRRTGAVRRQQWLWVSLILVATILFALAHIRTALYLAVVTVIVAGPMIEESLGWINERYDGWKKTTTGIVVRALFIVGPFSVALGMSEISKEFGSTEALASEQEPAKICDVKEMAGFLASDEFYDGSRELRFANGLDYGPQFVYRTPHHFLAVPYHRNGDSIYDTYDFLTTEDYGKSKEILDKYQIDYILLCPESSDRTYYQEIAEDERLYNRLIKGDLPEEMTTIAAPTPWRLFQYKVAAK